MSGKFNLFYISVSRGSPHGHPKSLDDRNRVVPPYVNRWNLDDQGGSTKKAWVAKMGAIGFPNCGWDGEEGTDGP